MHRGTRPRRKTLTLRLAIGIQGPERIPIAKTIAAGTLMERLPRVLHRSVPRLALLLAASLAAANLAGPVQAESPWSSLLGAATGSREPSSDGSTAAPQDKSGDLQLADTDAKIASLTEELQRARAGESTGSTSELTLQTRLEIWRKIRQQLQQLDQSSATISQLSQKLGQLEMSLPAQLATIQNGTGISFLVLDQWLEEQYSLRQRQKALETEVELARDQVDRCRARLESAERRERQGEEAARRKSVGVGPLLPFDPTIEDSRILAAQQLRVAVQDSQYQALSKRRIDVEYEQIGERLRVAQAKALFPDSDLQTCLSEITARREELSLLVPQSEGTIQKIETVLSAARDRSANSLAHEEYLRTLQSRLMVFQAHAQYLHVEEGRLNEKADVWNRRFLLFHKRCSIDELNRWRDESSQQLKSLDARKRVLLARIENIRAEIGRVESQLVSPEQTPEEVTRQRRIQVSELQSLIRVHQADLASVELHRRGYAKLLEECKSTTAIQAAVALVDDSWQNVIRIWNLELVAVEGSSITVKKIVIGLVLLLSGFHLSKFLAWAVAKTVLPRLGIVGNAVPPARTILFYVLFGTLALTALKIVSVPLTAFHVVGGALAIGVGVGSQTIASNFISGLILLAERPVRVGDTVEIEGVFGIVENIGMRATRIRTAKNSELILPNSRLLEKNLTNWTLSDNRVRHKVNVGLAYGSPTVHATELLLQAVHENDSVLKEPEPTVYFADFGDNSLVFEVHFWVTLSSNVDRSQIESQLRFKIDRLFRENGIVIAYPQRDIHLDTLQPITVQFAKSDDAGPGLSVRRAA